MGIYTSDSVALLGPPPMVTLPGTLWGPPAATPPPPLPRMGTEGCGAVGRRQGLGGDCPPLQFLMIFLFKGLQGERGLRGLTGEKGEPVRGGGRGVATDEEPWGDGLGPLGWLSSGRWEVKLSAPQP